MNTTFGVLDAFAFVVFAVLIGPDFFPPAAPVADKFLGTNNRSIKSGHRTTRIGGRPSMTLR